MWFTTNAFYFSSTRLEIRDHVMKIINTDDNNGVHFSCVAKNKNELKERETHTLGGQGKRVRWSQIDVENFLFIQPPIVGG